MRVADFVFCSCWLRSSQALLLVMRFFFSAGGFYHSFWVSFAIVKCEIAGVAWIEG
jgi:hypothetical protein